ncbi:TPA: hypothetical protein J1460_004808 [Escherichia coli]|nr:hypothetical protein [Escherichia coli]
MSSIIYANDAVKQIEFVPLGEIRPQWEEQGGSRNGLLIISGALLSSPCKVLSNEIYLREIQRRKEEPESYKLTVSLSGCGDGNRGIATIINQVAMFNRENESILQLGQNTISTGKIFLHDGDNKLIYFLNKSQYRSLVMNNYSDKNQIESNVNHILLHLMLGYE